MTVVLRWRGVVVAALLLWPGAVQGQEEAVPTLEFSYSNPGARSMGFGGAFVARADDATAAVANPAGLVQLVEPEVSVEGRMWSYSTPNVEGGRIFGPPTGLGLDTSAGLRVGESSEDLGGVSFLSLVYPRRNWSVGFYRHQVANYEFHGETGALFAGPWPGYPGSRARSWDLRKAIDLEIAAYGVSGAYRLTERLSFGLGVTYFDGRIVTVSEVFAAYATEKPTEAQFYGAESLFDPTLLVSTQSISGDDRDWGGLVGVLLQLSERWSLGAVFREGADLEGTSVVRAGPQHDSFPEGAVIESGSGVIEFPDVFGAGLSYRSSGDRLTLGFEIDRVTYSDILQSAGTEPEFVLEDGTELRLGAEYAFLDSRPIVALRFGAWLDPAHRIDYQGNDYNARAVLDRGSDEIHLALGVGLAFDRFQIDLGADLSDLVDTISLSTIYSF